MNVTGFCGRTDRHRGLAFGLAASLFAAAASTGAAQTRMTDAERTQWLQKHQSAANLADSHRTRAYYCDRRGMAEVLAELEQMARDARRAANAARAAGEFSTIDARAAEAFAANMDQHVASARARKPENCRDPQQAPQTPPPAVRTPGGATTTQVQPTQPQACPPPPPVQTNPPPEPVESILDEIEEMERWERERQNAERAQRQAQAQPQQGLTAADQAQIAQQQMTVDSFEAAIGELKMLVKQGRLGEARALLDELDDWLDYLERPTLFRGAFPKPLIDEWDRRIDDIIESFPENQPRPRLDLSSATILDLHNRTRAEYGVAPMRWEVQLACQAASYGPVLAQYDRPVHSPRTGRETSRENLLQALPRTPVTQMMAVWIAERQHLKPGVFPDVSITGNWADVGHVTQILWPITVRVGCWVQRGIGRFDWLICRYAPPGNRDGVPLPVKSTPPPRR